MVQNKVVKGSCAYVNGIAMTIVSATLIIIRRNGFRAISLITGESVSHRGTVVMLSDNCIVIKGGKPVHVMNPEHMFRSKYDEVKIPAERYTVQNGETRYVNPLQCLVGGNMNKITSALYFDYYWFDNQTLELTVMKKSIKKPIGYH